MATSQEIRIRKEILKRLPDSVLLNLQVDLGQELVELMRERSASEKDNKNKKFKKYSKSYKRFKKLFVSSKKSVKKKRKKGKISKKRFKTLKDLRKRAKPPFAARAVRDTMQLTGELFRDMKFRPLTITGGFGKGKKVIIPIELYIADRSLEKAEGLARRGYNFFGFPPGSFTNKQIKAIQKIVKKHLGT